MFQIDLNDKTAWVTGGSRGIGRTVCESLAKAGAKVVFSARSLSEHTEATLELLKQYDVPTLAVACDVSKLEEVESTYKKIQESFGKVDILVNSAGIIQDNLFVRLKEENWRAVMDTNFFGTMHTIKTVMRDMMSNRWGRVINFSSVASERGGTGQSNYAASKGAVEAMSRTLACEIGRRNITVNCLAPGVIDTEMTEAIRGNDGEKKLLEQQIIKRMGTTEEIAAWVVWLASEYSGFMTGQTVRVDGGLKLA